MNGKRFQICTHGIDVHKNEEGYCNFFIESAIELSLSMPLFEHDDHVVNFLKAFTKINPSRKFKLSTLDHSLIISSN